MEIFFSQKIFFGTKNIFRSLELYIPGEGGVRLVGAAEVAVAHVPAGLVAHAGELLQLGEVVLLAAVGAVTARLVGTCNILTSASCL